MAIERHEWTSTHAIPDILSELIDRINPTTGVDPVYPNDRWMDAITKSAEQLSKLHCFLSGSTEYSPDGTGDLSPGARGFSMEKDAEQFQFHAHVDGHIIDAIHKQNLSGDNEQLWIDTMREVRQIAIDEVIGDLSTHALYAGDGVESYSEIRIDEWSVDSDNEYVNLSLSIDLPLGWIPSPNEADFDWTPDNYFKDFSPIRQVLQLDEAHKYSIELQPSLMHLPVDEHEEGGVYPQVALTVSGSYPLR